nr:hypothetical protein [Candidatus Sigynarchaeota archaeon]
TGISHHIGEEDRLIISFDGKDLQIERTEVTNRKRGGQMWTPSPELGSRVDLGSFSWGLNRFVGEK